MTAPREKTVEGVTHLFCKGCRERLGTAGYAWGDEVLGFGRYKAVDLEVGYVLDEDNVWRRHRWERPIGRGRDYHKHGKKLLIPEGLRVSASRSG